MDDEFELDEAQSAILASMHDLMLRRGTEAVAIVVERYHRNVEVLHDAQQRLISSGRSVGTGTRDSPPVSARLKSALPTVNPPHLPPLNATISRITSTGAGGSVPVPLMTRLGHAPDSPSPMHRKGKAPAQFLRPSQDSPRAYMDSMGSPSQPQYHSRRTLVPPVLIPKKSPAPIQTAPATSLPFDSPQSTPPASPLSSPDLGLEDLPPSPIAEAAPDLTVRPTFPVNDLNAYAPLVRIGCASRGTVQAIVQEKRLGVQKRWYCVIRGQKVGIFNRWASAAVAVNGVSCAIHHGADTEELAYETFLDALFTGDVTISH